MTTPSFTEAFFSEGNEGLSKEDSERLGSFCLDVENGLAGNISHSICSAIKGLNLCQSLLQRKGEIAAALADKYANEFDFFLAKLELNVGHQEQIKSRPIPCQSLVDLIGLEYELAPFYCNRVNQTSSQFIGNLVELSKDKLTAKDVDEIAKKMFECSLGATTSAEKIAELLKNKLEAEKFSARQESENAVARINIFLNDVGLSALRENFELEVSEDVEGNQSYVCKFTKPKAAGFAARLFGGGTGKSESGQGFDRNVAQLMIDGADVMQYLAARSGGSEFCFAVDFVRLQGRLDATNHRPYEAPTFVPTATPATSSSVSAAAATPSVSPNVDLAESLPPALTSGGSAVRK